MTNARRTTATKRASQVFVVATLLAASAPALRAQAIQASAPDVAYGQKQFAQCAACHALNGRQTLGPDLRGVAGRKAAALPGYAYSAALKRSGLVWTDASLNAYLREPMKTVPGTKMAYAGLKDDRARASVIAYLKGLK